MGKARDFAECADNTLLRGFREFGAIAKFQDEWLKQYLLRKKKHFIPFLFQNLASNEKIWNLNSFKFGVIIHEKCLLFTIFPLNFENVSFSCFRLILPPFSRVRAYTRLSKETPLFTRFLVQAWVPKSNSSCPPPTPSFNELFKNSANRMYDSIQWKENESFLYECVHKYIYVA